MTEPKFSVGQRVWIYDVNMRDHSKPNEGTVTVSGSIRLLAALDR